MSFRCNQWEASLPPGAPAELQPLRVYSGPYPGTVRNVPLPPGAPEELQPQRVYSGPYPGTMRNVPLPPGAPEELQPLRVYLGPYPETMRTVPLPQGAPEELQPQRGYSGPYPETVRTVPLPPGGGAPEEQQPHLGLNRIRIEQIRGSEDIKYKKIVFPNGEWYEGEILGGKFHGKGKYSFSDGGCYEGDFKEGVRTGRGKYEGLNGLYYEGGMVDGKAHGQGEVCYPDGSSYVGHWFKSYIVDADLSQLKSKLFLNLLLATPSFSGISITYSLPILSAFLDSCGNRREANILQDAYQMFLLNLQDHEAAVGKIWERLEKRECSLIAWESKGHAMGLKIIPNVNEVDFEIYNRGEGIDLHPFSPQNGKFQTKLVVSIPRENFTRVQLSSLLGNRSSFTEESYSKLFQIQGSRCILTRAREIEVWQSEQKSENCGIQWIFAYLRHCMGPIEYNKMRLNLCKACIASLQEGNGGFDGNQQERQEIVAILEAKGNKRIKKLQELEPSKK